MEVSPAGADEAHAHVEAGDQEDGGQQHPAAGAEQQARRVGQGLRPVGGVGHGPAGQGPHMGQHAVHRQQQHPGDHPGPGGGAHHRPRLLHPAGPQVHRDDDAEGQGGQGVHGLIALQEAPDGRVGQVLAAGRAVSLQGIEHAGGKGHHNEAHQHGAEDLAQPVSELLRPQGQRQGGGEEHQGVNQAQQGHRGPLPHKGGHRHLKGGGGRPGDGQAGADGQIDRHGKGPGKGGVHPAGQGVHAAGPGHRHHPQHRQAHGADGQSRHGRPGVHPRHGPDARRENQVARPEKQGEQGQAHQQQAPRPQSLLLHSFTSSLSR